MSSSSVFWKLFCCTGNVGAYLLYKYSDGETEPQPETVNENELSDVAGERG